MPKQQNTTEKTCFPLKKHIQILVIDTRTVERKGLSFLLNAMPSMAVVGEAATLEEAVLMVHTSQPDVVLIDYRVIHEEGPDSVRQLWRENNKVPVFVLFSGENEALKSVEIDSGRIWFFTKDIALEELAKAIERIVCVDANPKEKETSATRN